MRIVGNHPQIATSFGFSLAPVSAIWDISSGYLWLMGSIKGIHGNAWKWWVSHYCVWLTEGSCLASFRWLWEVPTWCVLSFLQSWNMSAVPIFANDPINEQLHFVKKMLAVGLEYVWTHPIGSVCMPYMVTFAINIPPMLAYIPYMDPMGYVWTHLWGHFVEHRVFNRVRKAQLGASTADSLGRPDLAHLKC